MTYVKQINGDEYVETGKLDMTKTEVKTELQKEGLESIKGVLDKQYTEAVTVNDNDIISIHEKYKQKGDYSQNITYKIEYEKILTKPLTEGMFLALVNAKVNNKDFNMLLKIDGTNQTYSLFLEDYLTKYNYSESMSKDNINISQDEITSTGYNHYVRVDATDSYIVTQYFSEYKNQLLNNTQEAYNLLDTDYSEKKYGSYEKFQKYIDENNDMIKDTNIESYQVNEYEGQTEYVCVDNNGKYYIFLTDSVMSYKVVLDTYTIDLPTFTEKYNSNEDEIKVGLNIQRIFDAINDGDYKYVYNKLDSTFKANNFKTEADFEKYVKTNFYTNNTIKHDSCEKNGNLYMYNITITNKADEKQQKTKTIIMQLKEDTDFVMSFNVK